MACLTLWPTKIILTKSLYAQEKLSIYLSRFSADVIRVNVLNAEVFSKKKLDLS